MYDLFYSSFVSFLARWRTIPTTKKDTLHTHISICSPLITHFVILLLRLNHPMHAFCDYFPTHTHNSSISILYTFEQKQLLVNDLFINTCTLFFIFVMMALLLLINYPAVFSRCDVWMRARATDTWSVSDSFFFFTATTTTMKIYAAALLSSLASAVVAFESTVPCLMWSPKEWVSHHLHSTMTTHNNPFNVRHDIDTHCIYKQLLYTYHGCHWTVHCRQRWCRYYHLVVALSRHLWCQVDCCRWPTRCMLYCNTVAKRGRLSVSYIDPCQRFLAFRSLCCHQGKYDISKKNRCWYLTIGCIAISQGCCHAYRVWIHCW